jgi:hypothetical protein
MADAFFNTELDGEYERIDMKESSIEWGVHGVFMGCSSGFLCGAHLWSSPVELTCGAHLWSSPVELTCGAHLWSSPVELTRTVVPPYDM